MKRPYLLYLVMLWGTCMAIDAVLGVYDGRTVWTLLIKAFCAGAVLSASLLILVSERGKA